MQIKSMKKGPVQAFFVFFCGAAATGVAAAFTL